MVPSNASLYVISRVAPFTVALMNLGAAVTLPTSILLKAAASIPSCDPEDRHAAGSQS